MKELSRWCTGMLAGGAVLFAAGCNETRDTGAVTSKTSQGTSKAPPAEIVENREMALVRVVNAIPGGRLAAIYAGDSAVFTGLAYQSATGFKEIPDDRFDFKLDSPDKPLAENRENLNDGGHYTIVAMPDAGGADKRNLRVLDDELKPVSAEKARVRVINAIPGDLEISVFVRGREEPLFDGINFKSEAGWNEVDPIAGTLEIRAQGKQTVLASKPNVKLEGATSYTFVISGRAAKPDVISIEDEVM